MIAEPGRGVNRFAQQIGRTQRNNVSRIYGEAKPVEFTTQNRYDINACTPKEARRKVSMPKQILVVDDDVKIREIITFVLSRQNYEVTVAENGVQLQEMLASLTPDLIILDVMMPGFDGYHLFSRLRQNPSTRHTPVIIMTAHAEKIYERISIDLGASEHITKPFHPLELVEKVRKLLLT